MDATAAAAPHTTQAPPPSPRHSDDELLLTDAITGVVPTTNLETFVGGAPPLSSALAQLPPLNLSSVIAASDPPVDLDPPPSTSQTSTPPPSLSSSMAPPRPPPHKSSFSVPPSSRAHHTFSVLDTDHSDALHARAANYETLLRQFSLPRGSKSAAAIATAGRRRASMTTGAARRIFRPPSVAASRTGPSSVLATSRAPTGRLARTSSAEDLRHSLSRLGSSFALDRIRRRSLEGAARAASTLTTRDSDGGGSLRGLYGRRGRRRVSFSRTLRRARLRVARSLYGLIEPLSPVGAATLIHQIAVLALLVVQVVYTPFAAGFLVLSHDHATRSTMVSANIALELVWLVDIALRLNTVVMVAPTPPHPHHMHLITSRAELAKRYLRSGAFAVDVVGALPLETVFSLTVSASSSAASSAVTVALVDRHAALSHVGNALRLLKLRLALPSWRAIQHSPLWRPGLAVPPTTLAALQAAATLAVTVHYLACAWHALLFLEHDPELPRLAQAYVHAVVEMSLLLVGDGSTATHAVRDHSTADGHAALAHDAFVLGVVALGVLLSAVVFARLAVALLLSALHARETNAAYTLERSLATLTTRMDRLELPPKLQQRVSQYYTHLWASYHVFPSGSDTLVLAGLSPPLALEVALSRYAPTLGRLPLWKGCSADLLSALLVDVTPRVYLCDDFVRRKGERVCEMLVLQRGSCEFMASSTSTTGTEPVAAPTGSPQKVGVFQPSSLPEKLTVGAALGQLALLVDYKSAAYVRALGPLEVAVLTRSAFEELLHRFADDRTGLVRRVLRRGLETRECAALTQLAGLSSSPQDRPLNGGPPIREAAKKLVRLLGIDTLPLHRRLKLPLSLEAPEMPTVRVPSQRQASLRRTFTTAHTTSDAATAATSVAATGTTRRLPELDALAQTHETLLQLVTHLSDTAARLDAKLTRMEERTHRAEDAARFAAASNAHQASVLLRRRSSQRSSIEPTTATGLLRRPSNVTTTTSLSESTQNTGRLEFQATRMLLPEEIAALEATAAIVAEAKSSSFNEARDTLVSLPPPHANDEDAVLLDLQSFHAVSSPSSEAAARRATRSRSLGVATRQRLASFQQAITGNNHPSTSSSTGSSAAGSGTPPRRPSLSAMWSRKTADA